MYNPSASMTLYRRHLRACRHRKKKRAFTGCRCPIWADGILNGARHHKSLKTTVWEKALRKLAALESVGEDKTSKMVTDAIAAWDGYLVTQQIRESTLTKYRRLLRQFSGWCDEHGYAMLDQITVPVLDGFRSSRKKIAASTSTKELETLRGFFAFCCSRRWCVENPAKQIKAPKVPPNQVIPYTPEETASILAACEHIGQQPYERLRARAVLLLLRHTGLRISDALMLRKDQVRNGAVQMFTKKTGGHILLPVPQELEIALACLPLPEPLKHDNGYYFWNGQATSKRLLESAERTLRSVFRKSGVKNAHAHRCRHTLATELLGQGATEQDVGDILGVSPHIVRKHYGKWSQARQNRIFDLMRKYQGVESATEPQKSVTPVLRGHSRSVN